MIKLDMEGSMFPSGNTPKLASYELHLAADTRVTPFVAIPTESIRRLRLTGDCHLPDTSSEGTNFTFASLQSLTMVAIIGNMFDQHGLPKYFPNAVLDTFIYKHGHRLGFEIRDVQLLSLANGYGARLRKLVLLGCSRPRSAVISHCLQNLPVLEYFALSLLTVAEVRDNFILSLPSSLVVLKLAIRNAWYALPLYNEERVICNALEESVLRRCPPLQTVCVDFRDKLMDEGDRLNRWLMIAVQTRFDLNVGLWEMHEEV